MGASHSHRFEPSDPDHSVEYEGLTASEWTALDNFFVKKCDCLAALLMASHGSSSRTKDARDTLVELWEMLPPDSCLLAVVW